MVILSRAGHRISRKQAGRGFAVAAGHDLTASSAAAVLRAGGGAVDAAIAACFTACVVEPVLASLMGGGFFLYRDAAGKALVLDCFADAPRRLLPEANCDIREITADFGTTTQAFHIGAASIATPGLVRGLMEMHSRYGTMDLRELASQAVELARSGHHLSEFQAQVFEIVKPIYTATPEICALFSDSDGKPLTAGARWKNPRLADAMDVLAREGERFFYEGEIAGALLQLTDAGDHSGMLRAEDLKEIRAIRREPLRLSRRGCEILLNPPPSAGGAMIALALDLFNTDTGEPERSFSLAGALSATHVARLETGTATDALLDPALLARLRAELAGRVRASRGTTHISVIDSGGVAVGLTLSNGEGCGLVAPGTGMTPNNMLGEADLAPRGIDALTPGARLASLMCPACIPAPDGSVVMLGSGGSSRIPTALTRVISEITDHAAALHAAVTAPRLHVGETGLDFEAWLSPREALARWWTHRHGEAPRIWEKQSMFFGGVHAAARRMAKRGGAPQFEAAGDQRRAGGALSES